MGQAQAVLENDRGGRYQIVGRLGDHNQRVHLLPRPAQIVKQALRGIKGQIGKALPGLRHPAVFDANIAYQTLTFGTHGQRAIGEVGNPALGYTAGHAGKADMVKDTLRH